MLIRAHSCSRQVIIRSRSSAGTQWPSCEDGSANVVHCAAAAAAADEPAARPALASAAAAAACAGAWRGDARHDRPARRRGLTRRLHCLIMYSSTYVPYHPP